MLLEKFPDVFMAPIQHTTRAARPGEEEGVHFYFVQKSFMEAGIPRQEFFQVSYAHMNIQAISLAEIERISAAGKICLLDTDLATMQQTKNSMLVCKYAFIAPPSMEELEERLKFVNVDSLVRIGSRITAARVEYEQAKSDAAIDSIIINETLEQTLEDMLHLCKGWYPEYSFIE